MPAALGPSPQLLSRTFAGSAAVSGLVSRSRRIAHRSAVHMHGRVGMCTQPPESLPSTNPRRDPLLGCAGRLELRGGAARRSCGACAVSRARSVHVWTFVDVIMAMWADMLELGERRRHVAASAPPASWVVGVTAFASRSSVVMSVVVVCPSFSL